MLFKKRLQNRAVKRLKKRAPSNFMPIGNAHRVAFILESDEEGIEESVDYLVKELIDRGIKWIGMVVERHNKRSVDFSHRGDFIIIRNTDLTYYGLPKSIDKIEQLNEKFDILIDISANYEFTTHYISRYIDATFKVGRYSSESDSAYDFIAKAADDNPLQYIKQVIHYLESIKPARL